MALIYLIRHGKAAASYTDDADPGLDATGHAQAQAAASRLLGYQPLVLRSSPLRRAWQTAEALVAHTGQTIDTETRLAEIPSPGLSLEERGPWLRTVMQGHWPDQSPALLQWRQELIDCLLAIDTNTAVFSHYVAINVAVGAAMGDSRVLVCQPDNASITVLETDGKTLTLVSRGDEASTHIN